MRISSSIFKKYDIRGKFPEEINERAGYLVARAFSDFLPPDEKKIVVSRDDRASSISLKRAIIKGLKEGGKDVVDIGSSSTPAFYFAVSSLGADAGMCVTPSHLPAGYSGIKIVGRNAVPVGKKEGLEDIERMIRNEEVVFNKKNTGRVIKKDIKTDYVEALRGRTGKLPRLKVVMDAGNGMTGLYLQEIFEETAIEAVPLFWEVDGTFPNHPGNPKIPEFRRGLKTKIRENKADIGFMWDADGDRFYAMDSKGEVIAPEFVTILIGSYLMEETGNRKIVVDVRASRVVKDEIEKRGGEVICSKTWHPEIKNKMRSTEAVLGSEMSGHHVFRDFYYIDDGILASIYFLKAVAGLDEELADYLGRLRASCFIMEEKNFEVRGREETEKVFEKLEGFYEKKGGKIKKMDGLTIAFPEWGFNLHPSESGPVIRLNMEARSENLFHKKKKELLSLIESCLN